MSGDIGLLRYPVPPDISSACNHCCACPVGPRGPSPAFRGHFWYADHVRFATTCSWWLYGLWTLVVPVMPRMRLLVARGTILRSSHCPIAVSTHQALEASPLLAADGVAHAGLRFPDRTGTRRAAQRCRMTAPQRPGNVADPRCTTRGWTDQRPRGVRANAVGRSIDSHATEDGAHRNRRGSAACGPHRAPRSPNLVPVEERASFPHRAGVSWRACQTRYCNG